MQALTNFSKYLITNPFTWKESKKADYDQI